MRRMFVIALALLAVPAAAQNSLPGLENFTLDRRPPAPSPTPTASATPAPAATAVPTPPPAVVALPTPRASASPRPAASAPSQSAPSPAATPAVSPAPLASATAPAPVATPTPVAAATSIPVASPQAGSTWPLWAGLLLALLGLCAGAWWWWRQRQAAATNDWDEPPAEPPTARPVEAAPPAAPPAAPAGAVPPRTPGGIVTSTLRPEVTFDLTPLGAGIDALRASADFRLLVANVGRAPAVDLTIEAWLLGAGNDPLGELGQLLAQPPGEPLSEPFVLPAGTRADLTSQVLAPREALATITAGERRLFVPMVAVRARWQDPRGQPMTTSAAFLIGVPRPGQDRLAPLALDRGTRSYREVAARRLD